MPSLDRLRECIDANNFDIICLTETWLSHGVEPPKIHNYCLARKDRVTRGGGVGLYIKNNIKYRMLDVGSELEQLWVSLKINKMDVNLGVVYRPPTSNFSSFMDDLEKCTYRGYTFFCYHSFDGRF